MEDMNENWNQRRGSKKQRIHFGLWMKEIEKQEEPSWGIPSRAAAPKIVLSFSFATSVCKVC